MSKLVSTTSILLLTALASTEWFVRSPALVVVEAFSFRQRPKLQQQSTLRNLVSLSATVVPDSTAGFVAPVLKSLLKKPSKVLTVGVEFAHNTDSMLDKNELSILSMQLRKSKVSSIWCTTVDTVQVFSEEQATAQGNFPGPVPVIFHGPLSDSEKALSAGASAIVVSSINEWNKHPLGCKAEIIWKVSSIEDVQKVLELTGDEAAADAAFWLDGINYDETTMKQITDSIPKSSLCIASLYPMQPDGGEIEQGKQYKACGCASMMIKNACVGDVEDIEYSQFLVSGLTSKASSEFKFSGLTGSTNGHFGGVQANNKVKWRRVQR
jgi:hypothetical protein